MIFQNNYWFATSEPDRLETIQHFLEQDAEIKTLLILQKNYESNILFITSIVVLF